MVDNKDITINCPACGKEMEKIYMPEQEVFLDVCTNGCGGIYFDNREFLKFDEPHEDISPLEKIFADKTFMPTDQTATRVCPVCGMNMVKNFASSKHQIQVDDCYGCGGKFLDYAEINKIREQYTNEQERADDVIKELYANAGIELKEFNDIYNKSKDKPSLLTKIIKIKHK